MPASAIVSETQVLQAMWMGSLVLSLLSIFVMAILIFRRLATQRWEKKMAQRSQEISSCLYAALKSPIALTAKSLPVIAAAEYPAVMRISLDRLRSLRGEDTRRIVKLLELWNMSSYIHKTAESGRKGKRIQALTLLGYFSDEESLSVLLRHAGADDTYVQIAALRGLALRGAKNHITQIVASISRSKQTNTLMLSDILHRFGEPAVPTMLKLARSNANLEVRVSALMALGSIGSLQAVDDLIVLADDHQAEIRAHAIAALGKIGDGSAADAIVGHLAESDIGVRLQTVQALGRLQISSTMPQLAACLADDNWWVRYRAAESLHRFGLMGIAALKAFSAKNSRAGQIARQVLAEHAGAA
jgi:hypothetical protein